MRMHAGWFPWHFCLTAGQKWAGIGGEGGGGLGGEPRAWVVPVSGCFVDEACTVNKHAL